MEPYKQNCARSRKNNALIVKVIGVAITSCGFTDIPQSKADAQETRTVQTGDLDLANDIDVKRLQGRVNRAVRAVCATDSTMDFSQLVRTQNCRRVARAGADRQVAALIRHNQLRAAIKARSEQAGMADVHAYETGDKS